MFVCLFFKRKLQEFPLNVLKCFKIMHITIISIENMPTSLAGTAKCCQNKTKQKNQTKTATALLLFHGENLRQDHVLKFGRIQCVS